MSVQEVNDFFKDFVYGFILTDIEREIAFAKSEIHGDTRSYSGGGNYLCALGLLCYTEFMGGIVTGSFSKGSCKNRFDAFFNKMGTLYKSFNRRVNVYKVFRCGMAHEYFIKKSGGISMLKEEGVKLGVDGKPTLHSPGVSLYRGAFPCGIGILDDGQYFFGVEQYYEDFAVTCRKVHKDISDSSNPSIPKR